VVDGTSVKETTPKDDVPSTAPQNPESAAKIIMFALSELSSDNGHHDFEHLCRHITRRRICSNILPATGPVSGGGDGGADFESLPVQMESATSRYWQMTSTGKVLFACSLAQNLKRKVAADVAAAAQYREPVDRLYFFYNRPVKTADRNKLKSDALREHGIKLEIIDAKAIAEFLADTELLWTAERYLSLPIELVLPPPSNKPPWYDALLTDSCDGISGTSDTFFQLKAAIRHATAVPELHSDIPRLIARIKRYRTHPDSAIARKAFYEEFVATLRGLNAAEGYEAEVLDYLSAIETLVDPQELEDASILLGYADGARSRGILQFDVSKLKELLDSLLSRLESRMPKEPSFVRCSLLFTKGFVELKESHVDDAVRPEDRYERFVQAARKSVATWTTLLKEADSVKLFPVERLSNTVNFLYTHIEAPWFAGFVSRLDELVAERAGTERISETLAERASALLEDDQHMKSLQIFHRALGLSHSAESQSSAIIICLQLAELYKFLGLSHAGKYYGLAAAYAALRLPVDDLRRLAAVGLGVACEADYATGASLLFFLTYASFVFVATEFRIAGSESYRQEKWATVDYYALLLTRGAMLFGPDLHQRILEGLKRAGGEEPYLASQCELDAMFGGFGGDLQALSKSYGEQGVAAPFSDFGGSRTTSWQQLGIRWSVSWPSRYDHERFGEGFCTLIQIVCAALHGTELSIVAESVNIDFSVGAEQFSIMTVPSNSALEFSVALDTGSDKLLEEQLAAVYEILMRASAIAEEDFTTRFQREFRDGLLQRIGVYVAPDEAFRHFYDAGEYSKLHENDPEKSLVAVNVLRTHPEIAEVPERHPAFNEGDALEQVANRYRRILAEFRFTLQQLSQDRAFLSVVSRLRADGWKDWHILQAVASARLNSLMNSGGRFDGIAREIMERGEQEMHPLTPGGIYTEQCLRRCLDISQVQTLHNLGFELKQRTPNFPGVNRLLMRFRYWDLDIPHEDPFHAI
jgi:hypothetical protein